MNIQHILFSLVFFSLVIGCTKSNEPEITPINFPTDKGFTLLSEYNFFVGTLSDLNPNTEAGVLPYDLNMALFSDYASKKRFIYVPKGSTIPLETNKTLNLPVGSILIKHFYYPESNGTERYIETRLLIRKADGWQPETYEWKADKSDAVRTIVGGTRNLMVEANGQTTTFHYLIPNQNQCKNCHAFNGNIEPIGPNISNLNKEYAYSDGSMNQLTKWAEKGFLENNNPQDLPKWHKIGDMTATLEERSRAYLAVNCASCHRREGSAANSGLYLEYENVDSLSLGFWKGPVAAGGGSGGLNYVIYPGKADQSILLYRMNTSDVEKRMPEIGRELLHEDGINLIRDWIDSM